MSSGEKNLVYNTRERALSTDFDRQKAFIARDRSQLARFRHNDLRQNYYVSSGVTTQYVGGEAPLAADVYGGLMVDPQTSNLHVKPGELGCLFPDPGITADDSPYMLIDDPGLTIDGVLVFTANGGGGPRVDLVECHPVSTILETDNRDIFNPATGLFAPATVTKVQAFRLQYRLRLGTPGGGCPALAAGWLPLAAVVTPTTAVDFTTCDLYDVRPLVEDRVNPQIDAGAVAGNHRPRESEFSTFVVSGSRVVGGYAFNDFNGYRAGGALRKSSPSLTGTFGGTGALDGDPPFFNLDAPENHATGFAHAASVFNNLYAFFPAGLPRWVRYSETGARVPRGPLGVLAIQRDILGQPAIGRASVSLSTLPVFGPCDGVLLAVFRSNSAGTAFNRTTCQDGRQWTDGTFSNAPAAVVTASDATWTIRPCTDYPSGAKKLFVTVQLGLATATTEIINLNGRIDSGVLDLTGVTVYAGNATVIAPTGSARTRVEMPVPGRSLFNEAATFTPVQLIMEISALFTTVSTATAQVVGWEI